LLENEETNELTSKTKLNQVEKQAYALIRS